MPHKHAAIKAVRQSKRHRKRNDSRRRTIEILTRQFHSALNRGGSDAAGILPKLVKAIDKASKRHILNTNTASRVKSRLMRAMPRSSS